MVTGRVCAKADTLIQDFELVYAIWTISKCDDVVKNGRIAGFKFDRFDPHVFFQFQWYHDVAVILYTSGRNRMRWHIDYHVRLAVGPLHPFW